MKRRYYMFDIGLSTCGKVINEELFRDYRDNHITHMEISVAADEYKNIDFKNLKKWSDEFNITLWSYHLPFSPFSSIDISKKSLQKRTLNFYYELIGKASEIGIRNFVVHPSGEPILDCFRERRKENSKESLFRLAEKAKQFESVVLVEDLPRTCLGRNSAEILELISVHDALRVCFDTNHLLSESINDFLDSVGNKIVSTHISDYDILNERHWLPGEGVIKWNEVYNKLKDSGYKGPWLYEIGFNAPNSIKRLRNLKCSDFYNNANEIFNNKEITVISEPVKNLTAWK